MKAFLAAHGPYIGLWLVLGGAWCAVFVLTIRWAVRQIVGAL